MKPSVGYERARKILQERFGNKWRISDSWVQRITKDPKVKISDPQSIEELADDVRCCVENLRAMDMLDQIYSQVRMQEIRGRLPD
jgi:hypothetical protein